MPTLRRRSDSPHDPAPSGQGSGPYRQRSNTTDKSSTSEGSQVSRVELREFRSITVEPSNAASSSPYRATESGPDSQQSVLSLAFCFEGNQVKLGEINGLKGDNLRSQLMNDAGAAQKIIDCHIEKSSYEEGFCILTKHKPSKEGGYVQLSHDGANKFATVQEVLLWARGEKTTEDRSHVSHLCDQPKCLVKEHVVAESPTENNSRKNCGKVIKCAHCDKYYQACDHTPRCIMYVDGFESWEQFVEKGLHN